MSAPVLPDEQVDVPVVLVPDRAEAPISEITERFFRALLLKVPLDRIEELHLFSPLRSGGVETGIAVIAAREIIVPPPVADMELPLGDGEVVAANEDATVDVGAAEDAGDSNADAVDDSMGSAAEDPPIIADNAIEAGVYAALDEPSPYADELSAMAVGEDVAAEAEAEHPADLEAPVAAIETVALPTPIVRHTVYTARYRLVQKGPERGKWESDVVAEAEAPLITVEMVVRGVQRRAGEDSDTTRFTAAQIARALRIELPTAP